MSQSVVCPANYENGETFFKIGGQKEPQIDILLPGPYRINLNLFQIQIAGAFVIDANKVGLVIALEDIG